MLNVDEEAIIITVAFIAHLSTFTLIGTVLWNLLHAVGTSLNNMAMLGHIRGVVCLQFLVNFEVVRLAFFVKIIKW